MKDISTIISIIVFALSVISSVISIIISKFKQKSNLEECKSNIKRSEEIVEIIRTIVPQAVMMAETNITGSQNKKLLAISKIMVECASKNINYNENAELIDTCIEALIAFSKEVNKGVKTNVTGTLY